MLKRLSLLAVIASLVSLTACSSATSQSQALASPGECADTSAGAASKAISVSGDFGSIPDVVFAKDTLSADATERTIVSTGDGEQVKPGDTTFVEMSIYNAVTGSIVAQTAYGASPATAIVVNDQKYLKGLVRAVECTTVGSRVAAFVTASDGFGSAGSSDGTVQADQPLVVVADVLSTVHSDAKADGVPQEPVAGMPTVELDATGRPTVTVPKDTAPADLQVAVLQQGDGAVVEADAEVIINYQGVNWRTGEVFDESWGNGPTNFQLSAVVKGFSSAIAGQRIGSQVIAIIPPDLGYGPSGGNSKAGIEADDTIVFVIDILDASSTTAPAAG
ncbi:MAG TPA: FKBP-type peptidyl-prolyl cis-trans isomerase [Plantibacter sp.]|uniref:FKBP-type peptidyl-prolyl cis-trans isomerase n=1 Tax=Plantibacter sp. TaxID=1871045 RepID=UPI002CE752CA|nr:FKBP-type peptidyl-prolyl cis-trans isomerase [Plantibacter sp.]